MNRLAITLGDPFGIGPEVAAKAISLLPERLKQRLIVIGCIDAFRQFYPNVDSIDVIDVPCGRFSFERYRISYARSALSALETAVDLCRSGKAGGIVSAPVNKEKMSGLCEFSGHTEYFQSSFPVDRVEMIFASSLFNLMLVTRHIPISDVPGFITRARIRDAIYTATEFSSYMKDSRPVGVCGLNPHAGEGGIIGKEEKEIITPVIREMNRKGLDVCGPFPADTIFKHRRRFSIIVSMYHDQGLSVLKTMSPFSVNVTWGLSIVRTSPDHGTGFDIRGQGRADPRSMLAAIRMAFRLMRGGRK